LTDKVFLKTNIFLKFKLIDILDPFDFRIDASNFAISDSGKLFDGRKLYP
jgi:hypothetical protein